MLVLSRERRGRAVDPDALRWLGVEELHAGGLRWPPAPGWDSLTVQLKRLGWPIPAG
jgi:hypothetical protein